MKEKPRAGASASTDFVVETRHAIDFGPPVPAVLSTPSLVWHIEHAAIDALKPFLAPGEISLGTAIDIQHLAPTPIGATVTCTARIVRAEGARVLFQVEARDDRAPVARGLHHRAVVNADAFAKRLPHAS
ncbi:MAG TPA: hotdog domain-containing protein [Verrucomicrobiae bacterium]|nr:hotdog domain-containing protein [Verrucomicrobiae bacterium]